MGKKRRLIDDLQERELERIRQEQKATTSNRLRRPPVERIISKDGMKDRQVSAKVNSKLYDSFTKINKEQGLSNNSALNMLISKYVRENQDILDRDSLFKTDI